MECMQQPVPTQITAMQQQQQSKLFLLASSVKPVTMSAGGKCLANVVQHAARASLSLELDSRCCCDQYSSKGRQVGAEVTCGT